MEQSLGYPAAEVFGDRKGMHEADVEQATRDLLQAITRRQPGARSGEPFGVNNDDLVQARISEAQSDTAIQWLLDKALLVRDEESEALLHRVGGIPEQYKLTDAGQR